MELNDRNYVSDKEYEEFLNFMEEYNKKKQEKKDKFHDSLLYAIYKYFKK